MAKKVPSITKYEEGVFASVSAVVVLITSIWGNYLISTLMAMVALVFFAERSFSGN
jgi:uncharacterized membrane protein